MAILDTRSDGEHFGTLVRAARGGAIPRSIHIEWTDNLDTNGKFKSNADLKTMYEKAGITPDKEVYSYCQGGYRAAHGYIALRLLGISESAQLHRLLEGMGRPHGSAVGNPAEKVKSVLTTQARRTRRFQENRIPELRVFVVKTF